MIELKLMNECLVEYRLDVVEDSTTIALNDIEIEIKEATLEYDGTTRTPVNKQ